jgi:hypothetical protein
MTVTIGRRELLAALGGAAAWPLAARAQQGERLRRIGVLMAQAVNHPTYQYLCRCQCMVCELPTGRATSVPI